MTIRQALSDLTGAGVETLAEPIASVLGLPGSGLAFSAMKALASSTSQGLMLSVYDEIKKRNLSTLEHRKHQQVFDVAEQTFWRLAEENGFNEAAPPSPLSESEVQYCWEVAEHVSLEGIRQSQLKKLDILGRYYGKLFYEGRTDWDNQHHFISVFGQLTFRQLVFVYLLCNNFPLVDEDAKPQNLYAVSEINHLVDIGLCKTADFRWGGEDKSRPEPLSWYEPTELSHKVYNEFMLQNLPEEDVKKCIDTFGF